MKYYLLGTIGLFKIIKKTINNYIKFILQKKKNHVFIVMMETSPDGYHTTLKEFSTGKYDSIGIQYTFQGTEIGNIICYDWDFVKEISK